MVHMAKTSKDSLSADYLFSTYSKHILTDPQCILICTSFMSRLVIGSGLPLMGTEVDTELWYVPSHAEDLADCS